MDSDSNYEPLHFTGRCRTFSNNEMIRKEYRSVESFNAEVAALNALKDYNFVPKVYEIDNDKKTIVMEKYQCASLEDGEKIVPSTFIEDMVYINNALIESGVIDGPDRLKAEHIFIDDYSKSPETHGVRIIDFDVDITVARDDESFQRKVEMAKKFNASFRQEVEEFVKQRELILHE